MPRTTAPAVENDVDAALAILMGHDQAYTLTVTPATIDRVNALTEVPIPADLAITAAHARAIYRAWVSENDDNRTVAYALTDDARDGRLNGFTDSLHGQLCRKGRLSERQVAAFMRGMTRRADQSAPAAAAAEEGVYERDGVVYVVKRARESGNLYAKQIVEIGGERLTEAGTVINAEFQYAPGVIRTLGVEHKMDLERAKALTIRYGFCIACGRHLKAAQSVEAGIGPVCRGKFA